LVRNSTDPLNPHIHDPNLLPPSNDPVFDLSLPDGQEVNIGVQTLQLLPRTTLTDCYIVSTGHGTTGPFAFSGVSLIGIIEQNIYDPKSWNQVEVISGDGFGTRFLKQEILSQSPAKPIVIADTINRRPMTRNEGLVRLIVPGETDDALRQVKWIARINILNSA
jgi:hypothetical protein